MKNLKLLFIAFFCLGALSSFGQFPPQTFENIVPSNGNVGLGTIYPFNQLHVLISDNGRDGIYLQGFNNDDIWLKINNGGGSHYLFDDKSNSHALKLESANDLVFNTNGPVEKMRIKENGRVGIGTSNPVTTLDVNGFLRAANIETFYYSRNTLLGLGALDANTTGNDNTALGHQALFDNTSGYDNTAIGTRALYNNLNGINNTAIGYRALYKNTSGKGNTAVGEDALDENVTGLMNTAVGQFAGPSISRSNTIAIGQAAFITQNNQARIGNNFVTSIGGYANWTNLSDGRFKKNVEENVPGIEFINKLRPVTYNLDMENLDQFLYPEGKNEEEMENKEYSKQARAEKAKIVYTGFIAQEVEKTAKELGYDFSGVDAPQNDQSHYGLRYAEFVVPLVVATQEQQQLIEAQASTIEELKERLVRLEQLISGNEETGQRGDVKSQNIKVYPNPTQGLFTVELPASEAASSSKIQVFDINGRLILERNDVEEHQFDVNLSTEANGTYIVHIIQGGKLFSQQLIKQ